MASSLNRRGPAGRRPARLLAAGAAFLAGVALSAGAEPSLFSTRVAPVLERHCVVCHGAEKQKAGLRLDSFEQLMKGAESGEVIKPGDPKGSELFHRITLPADDEDVMPSDGKPHLSADEIKVIELWIAGGASRMKPEREFAGVPPLKVAPPYVPLAPDWRPRAKEIAQLEKSLGVHLVPCSQIPTDGLILRTASAPGRCDDRTLEKLGPVAVFIVHAELARTKITDRGLKALAACENLREADLTRTAISSAGLGALTGLKKLEALNLTDTAVDDAGAAQMKKMPALKRVWLFGTKVSAPPSATAMVAK